MEKNKNISKFIYKINQPCVFKEMMNPSASRSNNSACTWTPKLLANLLGDKRLAFRIGKKKLSNGKTCFCLKTFLFK